MEFSDYQSRLEIIRQAYGLNPDKELTVSTLELCEEAGEVAGIINKSYRDGSAVDLTNLKKELGDVLARLTLIGDH